LLTWAMRQGWELGLTPTPDRTILQAFREMTSAAVADQHGVQQQDAIRTKERGWSASEPLRTAADLISTVRLPAKRTDGELCERAIRNYGRQNAGVLLFEWQRAQ